MSENLLLLPVLAQVILTLTLYVRLGQAKEDAVKAGQVDQARRALHDDAWPESVQKINNNIRNQFEAPVLFYVLVTVCWILNAVGPVTQLLAWVFVVLRIAHAYVHTGSNTVRVRKRLFQASMVTLMLMTVWAGVTLFTG